MDSINRQFERLLFQLYHRIVPIAKFTSFWQYVYDSSSASHLFQRFPNHSQMWTMVTKRIENWHLLNAYTKQSQIVMAKSMEMKMEMKNKFLLSKNAYGFGAKHHTHTPLVWIWIALRAIIFHLLSRHNSHYITIHSN